MPVTVTTRYICQQCGAESLRWEGKCHNCGSWNSLQEVALPKKERKSKGLLLANAESAIPLDQIQTQLLTRLSTGFNELDRVLGGGIVPGSVILIGGEPGIGKSTLLLQTILHVGGLYVTAEESAHQVKLRAERLRSNLGKVSLLATSNIDQAIATIQQLNKQPSLIVIDSIQTIATDDLDGVPGSIGQVRESAHRLVNLAKQAHIPIIVVSHVTKEGTIAGPKVLEHVVDVVAYIEGEEFSTTRLVRGVKNRFGPVHEVGVFELTESGLKEVDDTSALFLTSQAPASGSIVTITMEGARPMVVELQALATPTSFGLPRRTANGIDLNRLLMLIAVMSKRTKFSLGNQDIYTNISGGLRVKETALDLPTCLAIASSVLDQPLPKGLVAFGEVSLSGEIKSVIGQQKRLEQARKMGYNSFITAETAATLDQAMKQAFGSQFKSST